MNVVVITYDSNEDSLKFSDQYKIKYPILQDVEAKYVKMLGILNENYQPSHRTYGIPHPGIFLIDPSATIRARFAESDYKERPSMDLVIKAGQEMTP